MNYSGIDITKPLEEIERDIIQHVLMEENMNQSAAARRLGISRNTIWRKLPCLKYGRAAAGLKSLATSITKGKLRLGMTTSSG